MGERVVRVGSYMSPFVHSYNPNYISGLISPRMIGIIFRELRSKYMRIQVIEFNTM